MNFPVDFSAFVDIYCERTGPEFWSEPLNFLTNAAFLMAAVLPLLRLRRSGMPNATYLRGLCYLALCVGIGSGLFHSLAVVWAQLADVIPIGLFLVAYIYYLVKTMEQRTHLAASLAVVAFLLVSLGLAASVPRHLINGGEAYLGTMVTMVLIGAAAKRVPHAYRFYWSAVAFGFSLFFRTIDLQVCSAFPAGTHFLWHLLNGFVIWNVLDLAVTAHKERHQLQ